MASRIGVFLILVLSAMRIQREIPPQIAIWNVGQGQWVTIKQPSGCWHFDMGGEFAPWKAIGEMCRTSPNFVSLSHWDMDHIGLIGRARFILPQICRLNLPVGEPSAYKQKLLRSIQDCKIALPFEYWESPSAKSSNGKSRVVWWNKVLLPGDSSRAEEKTWVTKFQRLNETRILVLGHHGSHSSTSTLLLKHLVNTKLAIASARFRRYGHPHRRVEADLRKFQIPLLKTEDWGNIRVGL